MYMHTETHMHIHRNIHADTQRHTDTHAYTQRHIHAHTSTHYTRPDMLYTQHIHSYSSTTSIQYPGFSIGRCR